MSIPSLMAGIFFCWIGQRRFSRHWSVPQIRLELLDSYEIALSEDAIEDHIASVRDGPTLIPTLDAHLIHPSVFNREDLFAFRSATPPPNQLASQQRHGIMRKSRSKKTTPAPERTRIPNPKSQQLSGALIRKTQKRDLTPFFFPSFFFLRIRQLLFFRAYQNNMKFCKTPVCN